MAPYPSASQPQFLCPYWGSYSRFDWSIGLNPSRSAEHWKSYFWSRTLNAFNRSSHTTRVQPFSCTKHIKQLMCTWKGNVLSVFNLLVWMFTVSTLRILFFSEKHFPWRLFLMEQHMILHIPSLTKQLVRCLERKGVKSWLSQACKLCLCQCKEEVSRTWGKVTWNVCENQRKEQIFCIFQALWDWN